VSWNKLLSTWFGVGLAPLMPGTVASLVAAPIAWPIAFVFGHWILLPLGLVLGLAAVPISGAYVRECGRGDPSECVIDEVAGQWIACAFAPATLSSFVLAFLLFRFFDVTKIWPISVAEKLEGGVGIVADDIVAGSIAGLIMLLLSLAGYL
jgi:phosphatidylglycerophosphatase A